MSYEEVFAASNGVKVKRDTKGTFLWEVNGSRLIESGFDALREFILHEEEKRTDIWHSKNDPGWFVNATPDKDGDYRISESGVIGIVASYWWKPDGSPFCASDENKVAGRVFAEFLDAHPDLKPKPKPKHPLADAKPGQVWEITAHGDTFDVFMQEGFGTGVHGGVYSSSDEDITAATLKYDPEAGL